MIATATATCDTRGVLVVGGGRPTFSSMATDTAILCHGPLLGDDDYPVVGTYPSRSWLESEEERFRSFERQRARLWAARWILRVGGRNWPGSPLLGFKGQIKKNSVRRASASLLATGGGSGGSGLPRRVLRCDRKGIGLRMGRDK